MKVYQQVSGNPRSISNFEVSIEDTDAGFVLAAGTGDVDTGQGLGDGSTGLLNTGFIFSGYEGYIFDQSGRFVGGYTPYSSTFISVHMKGDDTYSYFINGDLIANNMEGVGGFDYIEFEKNGDSTLGIQHIHD